MSKNQRMYLVPFWVRVWHGINAVLILVLTVTGISLHFADPGRMLVEFSLAARIHDIAGVLLVAAYTFFVLANIVTGNWSQYVPATPNVFARCMAQAKYYAVGIFRGETHPHKTTAEARYNPLAAVTYWAVMYLLMPVVLVSGLVFMFPQFAPDRIFGMDGLLPIAMLHYLSGAVVVMFMIAHIYLGTMGKRFSSLYRMMINGWYEH